MNEPITKTLILSVALIISAYMISGGLKELGAGISRSGPQIPASIPSDVRVHLEVSSPGFSGLNISGIK